MFRTYPEAESFIPRGLSPAGEKAWLWMELGLCIPYFFVSAEVGSDEDGTFTRNFWFSNIDQVIEFRAQGGSLIRHVRLFLFSPGYINGGEEYRLDPIKQVLRHVKSPGCLRFVLADGSTLQQDFGNQPKNDNDIELIFNS